MLNYSVWSSYFVELSPEEMVREFLNAGFRATEFSDEHGLMLLERGNPEKEGIRLRRYAEGLGFTFPQGHLLLRADLCAEGAVETQAVARSVHRSRDPFRRPPCGRRG